MAGGGDPQLANRPLLREFEIEERDAIPHKH